MYFLFCKKFSNVFLDRFFWIGDTQSDSYLKCWKTSSYVKKTYWLAFLNLCILHKLRYASKTKEVKSVSEYIYACEQKCTFK